MISNREFNMDKLKKLVDALDKDDEGNIGAVIISIDYKTDMFSMYGFNTDEEEILDLLDHAVDTIDSVVETQNHNRTLN
jgi:polynucleotide 5'-kinase involved in rRNA processing